MEGLELDHIGIAVRDLKEVSKALRKIFGEPEKRLTLDEMGLEIVIFSLGDIKIEVISPTREDTKISNFIKEKKGGLHHIALKARNFEKTIEKIRKEGPQIIDGPRKGVFSRRVAFLNPRETARVLIEIVEPI